MLLVLPWFWPKPADLACTRISKDARGHPHTGTHPSLKMINTHQKNQRIEIKSATRFLIHKFRSVLRTLTFLYAFLFYTLRTWGCSTLALVCVRACVVIVALLLRVSSHTHFAHSLARLLSLSLPMRLARTHSRAGRGERYDIIFARNAIHTQFVVGRAVLSVAVVAVHVDLVN